MNHRGLIQKLVGYFVSFLKMNCRHTMSRNIAWNDKLKWYKNYGRFKKKKYDNRFREHLDLEWHTDDSSKTNDFQDQ